MLPTTRVRGWLRLGSLALILAITLAPVGAPHEPTIPTLCILCGDRSGAEFLLNAILFVPLGASLTLPGARPRGVAVTVLIGAVLSTAIELAQVFLPGRHPGLGDVAANTLGAGLGAMLSATASGWLRPPPGRSARLALAWGGLVACVAVGTGLLLVPDLPIDTYYVQWAPELGQFAHFGGEVLSARIGGLRLDPEVLPPARGRGLRRALGGGPALDARVRPGPSTPRLAPIVSVFDGREREIFVVGREGDDLIARVRRRADAWRLDRPELRVAGAFSRLEADEPVGLELRLPGGRVDTAGRCGEVDGVRRCGLGYPVGRGWAILRSLNVPPMARWALDLLWLLVLFFPLGWWAGPDPIWRLALLVAAAGVLAASAAGPLVGLGWSGLAGVTVGVAGGWALRLRDDRSRHR